MDQTTGQACTDQQIAEGTAAELESLSLECRIDPARLERLLAPDFHEFGTSGGQIGYEGTAARVAAATSPEDEPITAPSPGHGRGSLTQCARLPRADALA